jgi:hypothetical protein
MPRAPKPADMRQNTERVDVGDVPAGDETPLELPKPLRTWLAVTKASWERYWSSPARHVTVASLDLDGLERLWSLYDERTRAQRAIQAPQRAINGKILRGTDHRMVEGSQGQLRPNGLYNVIARLDAEIRQLEDRAGKSAKARLILGMRVGDPDAGSGTDDEGGRPDIDEPVDDIGPDPRLYLVDRAAG